MQSDTSEPGARRLGRRLTTNLEWSDLVLSKESMAGVDQIENWMKHRDWLNAKGGIMRFLPIGYRCLFSGPPGTGKTLTATLLGQRLECDVFGVDLSVRASNYIGETEKNLDALFDEAAENNAVLFFDEAGSLFDGYGGASTANDRHASQLASYLLDRIESHAGLIIFATNLRDNIHSAYLKRFQSVVEFQMPDAEARLRMWGNAFADSGLLEDSVDLRMLSERHELSGRAISNILQTALLISLGDDRRRLSLGDLTAAIAQELRKEARGG